MTDESDRTVLMEKMKERAEQSKDMAQKIMAVTDSTAFVALFTYPDGTSGLQFHGDGVVTRDQNDLLRAAFALLRVLSGEDHELTTGFEEIGDEDGWPVPININ